VLGLTILLRSIVLGSIFNAPAIFNIVRTYPADKFNLLNANTEFLIKSEESSDGALVIQAYSHPLLGSIFNAPAIFVIPKY
jgi:hypothetical protein